MRHFLEILNVSKGSPFDFIEVLTLNIRSEALSPNFDVIPDYFECIQSLLLTQNHSKAKETRHPFGTMRLPFSRFVRLFRNFSMYSKGPLHFFRFFLNGMDFKKSFHILLAL